MPLRALEFHLVGCRAVPTWRPTRAANTALLIALAGCAGHGAPATNHPLGHPPLDAAACRNALTDTGVDPTIAEQLPLDEQTLWICARLDEATALAASPPPAYGPALGPFEERVLGALDPWIEPRTCVGCDDQARAAFHYVRSVVEARGVESLGALRGAALAAPPGSYERAGLARLPYYLASRSATDADLCSELASYAAPRLAEACGARSAMMRASYRELAAPVTRGEPGTSGRFECELEPPVAVDGVRRWVEGRGLATWTVGATWFEPASDATAGPAVLVADIAGAMEEGFFPHETRQIREAVAAGFRARGVALAPDSTSRRHEELDLVGRSGDRTLCAEQWRSRTTDGPRWSLAIACEDDASSACTGAPTEAEDCGLPCALSLSTPSEVRSASFTFGRRAVDVQAVAASILGATPRAEVRRAGGLGSMLRGSGSPMSPQHSLSAWLTRSSARAVDEHVLEDALDPLGDAIMACAPSGNVHANVVLELGARGRVQRLALASRGFAEGSADTPPCLERVLGELRFTGVSSPGRIAFELSLSTTRLQDSWDETLDDYARRRNDVRVAIVGRRATAYASVPPIEVLVADCMRSVTAATGPTPIRIAASSRPDGTHTAVHVEAADASLARCVADGMRALDVGCRTHAGAFELAVCAERVD